MEMELKQLSYFMTVVREGTISGAARKLHLSQPPLSMQMKLLEEELGCVLFERGSRKIRLTEAGRLLYKRAGTLLELSEMTRQELQDHRDGVTGAVRLGAVSSVGSSLLPEWAAAFHREYPSIRFEVFEGNTYQLLEQLHAGLVELAVVRTPFHEEKLECHPLCEEPMLAAGHAVFWEDAGLYKSGEIGLETLSGLPLILYRRWEALLEEVFEQDGLALCCFCRNDDARTTARWADMGLGVGILPASSRPLLTDPRTLVCPIRDMRLRSRILAVHGQNARLSAAAGMFLQFLKKYSLTEAPEAPAVFGSPDPGIPAGKSRSCAATSPAGFSRKG